MNSPLLEKVSQPSDLKKLSGQQVVQLCADTVSYTHLTLPTN